VLVVTKVKAEGFVDAESMPAAEGTRPMLEFEELNAMVDGLPDGSDGRARCMVGPGRCWSPRHSISRNSTDEGYICVG